MGQRPAAPLEYPESRKKALCRQIPYPVPHEKY